jgi:ribosomal-protein-alanine N-acetyltransferase
MKTDFEIKRLTTEYTADVAKIESECFSRPWNEIAIAAELENEFSRFYVAIIGEKAVGYVGIYALTGEADIVRVAARISRQGNCPRRAYKSA